MTRSVELKLYAYRKNRDGLIVSFVVHPNDEKELTGVDIGDVFNATLVETTDQSDSPSDNVEHNKLSISALPNSNKNLTEGERLRTRAVLLCKDERFQVWLANMPSWRYDAITEETVADYLRVCLGIDSRSELALHIPAQEKFKALERRFREETGQAAERRGG